MPYSSQLSTKEVKFRIYHLRKLYFPSPNATLVVGRTVVKMGLFLSVSAHASGQWGLAAPTVYAGSTACSASRGRTTGQF